VPTAKPATRPWLPGDPDPGSGPQPCAEEVPVTEEPAEEQPVPDESEE